MNTLTVYEIRCESCVSSFTYMVPANCVEDAIKTFRKAHPKRAGRVIKSVRETDSKVHVL